MHDIEDITVGLDPNGQLKIGFRVGGHVTYVERFPPELVNELIAQLDIAQNDAHRQKVVSSLG